MQISRGLFGLAVVGAFVWVAQSGPPRSTEPAKATTAPAKPTPDPSETFEARNPQHELHVDFKLRLGGFDSVAVMMFTIRNGNTFAVKDVLIECEFRGPSGTVIHTGSKTIYEKVAAKKDLRTKEISFSFVNQQVKSAYCSALRAERV